jgi:phage terminase small subunit
MAILKNPRHERFANLIVDGNSACSAHKEAGFSGDRRDASRMRQRPDVTTRIKELTAAREAKLSKATERAVERHAVTIEGLLEEAADIQSRATEAGNYAAAISALTAKAKLAGL